MHQSGGRQPDVLAQRFQRHTRRDVVLGGPSAQGRQHVLTALGPPLGVDDPLADASARHRKTHGAQLFCQSTDRRAGVTRPELRGPLTGRTTPTQRWRPHVEHLEPSGDAMLAGVAQQPAVTDPQR